MRVVQLEDAIQRLINLFLNPTSAGLVKTIDESCLACPASLVSLVLPRLYTLEKDLEQRNSAAFFSNI
jgi:hypothetical protein